MGIELDWKAHLLVEYSKDRFACEVLEGQLTDDHYRVMDGSIYYRDQLYLVANS